MILYLTKAGAIFHKCDDRYTSLYAKVDGRYICRGYYQCGFSINKDIFESLFLVSKIRRYMNGLIGTSDEWYSASQSEFDMFIKSHAETIRVE